MCYRPEQFESTGINLAGVFIQQLSVDAAGLNRIVTLSVGLDLADAHKEISLFDEFVFLEGLNGSQDGRLRILLMEVVAKSTDSPQ